jgi:hypothetical protein
VKLSPLLLLKTPVLATDIFSLPVRLRRAVYYSARL